MRRLSNAKLRKIRDANRHPWGAHCSHTVLPTRDYGVFHNAARNHLCDTDCNSDGWEAPPLRRINRECRDILILCALTWKRKTTEKLIAPTNRQLRGVRTQQKRTLIRGP